MVNEKQLKMLDNVLKVVGILLAACIVWIFLG